MFEATADVSEVKAEELILRDAKEYSVQGSQTICIAQVEVVGGGLLERKEELLEAMREVRERKGYPLFALMVTDVLSKGTQLLVSGDRVPLERAFETQASDSVIELPGVMSRKKQVAPKVLAAL
jgi:manganese-dependent inorganic pyrophosphatase